MSVREFFQKINGNNKTTDNKATYIADIVQSITHSHATEDIYIGKDKIEISGFYYESAHEFFNNALSIQLNDELLFSGYYEYGINKEIFIKGKYKTSDEAIKFIEKKFNLKKENAKFNKNKESER